MPQISCVTEPLLSYIYVEFNTVSAVKVYASFKSNEYFLEANFATESAEITPNTKLLD